MNKQKIILASLSLATLFWQFNQLYAQPLPEKITRPSTNPSAQELKIDFPVEKFQLENGLTVILAQDRSVPMISYHTWYRVGSRDEKPGITGVAHMLEHMMFKGAKKYSGKEFDQILHSNGIVNNAFTSMDYTGFYQNLPSSKLELMMDMEVDRMRFLALKPEDLKSELQVVGEERRWRVDNNPNGLLREMMMENIYSAHPYTWPVIGWMKDIQAYTVDKLKDFYDRFYVPNNAVLVLAGDFEIEPTKKLVQKYYGVLKKGPLLEKQFPAEPPMKEAKSKILKSNVGNSSLIVGYHGVSAQHPDVYALDLTAQILGAGQSSRLFKRMVYQDQTSSAATASNMTPADPGVFFIYAALKPGQSWKAAEKTILSEVEKLKATAPSAKELEKVQNQVMTEFIQSLETNDGRAQALAVNEIIYGDYRRLFVDVHNYRRVTPQDIKRVANQYLKANQRVTGVLEPK